MKEKQKIETRERKRKREKSNKNEKKQRKCGKNKKSKKEQIAEKNEKKKSRKERKKDNIFSISDQLNTQPEERATWCAKKSICWPVVGHTERK